MVHNSLKTKFLFILLGWTTLPGPASRVASSQLPALPCRYLSLKPPPSLFTFFALFAYYAAHAAALPAARCLDVAGCVWKVSILVDSDCRFNVN